jgi:hypothetical protein
MNRVKRQVVAWFGIFALMFAQLAVSAYACPMTTQGTTEAARSEASAHCDKADRDQANLCEKHCHDSEQSQSSAPGVHGAFVPGFIAVVPTASSRAPAAFLEDPALLHATSPPATIRNRCFRI